MLCYAQFAPEPPALLQRITLPPHTGDGAAYSVLARFSAVAIGVAVAAMLLTPMITNTGRLIMTIAQILTRKFVQPGLDKLLNEGKAAAYTEFRDWVDRRDAAVARGEPFNEPAPDEAGNFPGNLQ